MDNHGLKMKRNATATRLGAKGKQGQPRNTAKHIVGPQIPTMLTMLLLNAWQKTTKATVKRNGWSSGSGFLPRLKHGSHLRTSVAVEAFIVCFSEECKATKPG